MNPSRASTGARRMCIHSERGNHFPSAFRGIERCAPKCRRGPTVEEALAMSRPITTWSLVATAVGVGHLTNQSKDRPKRKKKP